MSRDTSDPMVSVGVVDSGPGPPDPELRVKRPRLFPHHDSV